MKISIITINLNDANGLEKTIKSVISQTFYDFEYIIIDGCSNDGSVEVIRNYAERISNWVSEPDAGIYDAMNKGWKKAKGEYCLFLNSGDYLFDNNVLLNVNKKLIDSPIIVGKIIRDFGNKILETSSFPENPNIYNLTYLPIPHQAAFISRKLLYYLNGYDEDFKIISDWLFFYRVHIETSFKIKFIDDIISIYNMYGISSMNSHESERLIAINKYFPYLEPVFPLFKKLRKYELSRIHKIVTYLTQLFNR